MWCDGGYATGRLGDFFREEPRTHDGLLNNRRQRLCRLCAVGLIAILVVYGQHVGRVLHKQMSQFDQLPNVFIPQLRLRL